MSCFGSHVSCAGGLLQAIERAKLLGCQCMQIFVSTPRAWPSYAKLIPLEKAGKKVESKNSQQDLPRENGAEFRSRLEQAGLSACTAHATYLINLASADPTQWQRSVESLVVEWRRADQLQLDGLVMHPGSHTSSTADEGMANITRGIQLAEKLTKPQRAKLLLENTAGQGNCLGWNAEQLGQLLSEVDSSQVDICWDTCHALAAGYDFRTQAGLEEMVQDLRNHNVLERIQAVHINDSAKECGSRVDRHEHIGLGCIGEPGFELFLQHPAFSELPMYLETEKGVDEDGMDWDQKNLETLRRLAGCQAA